MQTYETTWVTFTIFTLLAPELSIKTKVFVALKLSLKFVVK